MSAPTIKEITTTAVTITVGTLLVEAILSEISAKLKQICHKNKTFKMIYLKRFIQQVHCFRDKHFNWDSSTITYLQFLLTVYMASTASLSPTYLVQRQILHLPINVILY